MTPPSWLLTLQKLGVRYQFLFYLQSIHTITFFWQYASGIFPASFKYSQIKWKYPYLPLCCSWRRQNWTPFWLTDNSSSLSSWGWAVFIQHNGTLPPPRVWIRDGHLLLQDQTKYCEHLMENKLITVTNATTNAGPRYGKCQIAVYNWWYTIDCILFIREDRKSNFHLCIPTTTLDKQWILYICKN